MPVRQGTSAPGCGLPWDSSLLRRWSSPVNGLKCPLTALAVRYGATTGYAFDTILTERTIRFTFRFFSGLMVLGLVLLVLRWAGVLG